MTVAVVKDGQVYFAKGYGWADVEHQVPVDATNTLFRPGSVSKLFTWTAVMQLVEQGKLDLDADVNTYLTQFKIPATFEGPITLRHALTHTVGMEDGGIGYLMARSPQEIVPAGPLAGRPHPRPRAARRHERRGHELVVLQLGHRAGRPGGRQRLRRVVRGLRGEPHPAPARHGEQHLQGAASGAAPEAHVQRLRLRGGRVQAEGLRVHRATSVPPAPWPPPPPTWRAS